MKTVIQIWTTGFLAILTLAGCSQHTIDTPQEIQFQEVGLQRFREIHPKNVKAVLLAGGDISPELSQCESEILFMVVEKRDFANRISLRNFRRDLPVNLIEDRNLLNNFVSFQAWENPFTSAFGAFLAYIVEENGHFTGYALPIDERNGMIQGVYWNSEELKILLIETLRKQGVHWETGEWSVEYRNIDNLSAFRKSFSAKSLQGILLVAGDILSDEHTVLFAMGQERLLSRIPMKHYDREIIENDESFEKLASFEFEENPLLPVFKTSLVYVERKDNKLIGSILPFGKREGVIHGKFWHSRELGDLIHEISQKYGFPFDD